MQLYCIIDLARMYKLCSRVENGLSELKKALEIHIEEQGQSAIGKAGDGAINVGVLSELALLFYVDYELGTDG